MRSAQHDTSSRITVISGTVTIAGAVNRGIGFTSYKTATGVYGVRWTFPVRQVRNIVVIPLSGAVFTIVDVDWPPEGFTVRTYTPGSVALDWPFGFTATVIPR